MDILNIFEEMVSTGQPPIEGCTRLGVGYEDAFKRLEETYINGFLKRGRSAEKFIIGPYGSGKTHFLRQLLELGRNYGCVTAEVVLSRDIEMDKPLLVYKEVAREIQTPEKRRKGIDGLLRACYDKIRSEEPGPELVDEYVRYRIDALNDVDFEDGAYRRILISALNARHAGDDEKFEQPCRWLNGEITQNSLARNLGVTVITGQEQGTFGRRALLSLCQFIKAVGYSGTVIGFDEAEQAAHVPPRHLQRILSMLRSEIDAVVRVRGASLLIVYAVLSDVIQEMQNYPALQQRIAEPDPTRKFFDGNTYSPRIDLDQPYATMESALGVLERIGERLVDLLYEQYGAEIRVPKEKALTACYNWAEEASANNPSISNRRDMVKATVSRLLYLKRHGNLEGQFVPPEVPAEGDAEV